MLGREDDKRKSGEGAGKETTSVSPYYMHPSDNPGKLITPIQLKGDNYEEWARAIRNALRAKKKLAFVDGTITETKDDSTDIEDWWMVNSMLVVWILNTIEPSLRSTITYMESVRNLWEDFQQRFSIGNGARVYQLKTDLAGCKQMGQTVVVYYVKVKVMWDELISFEPTPTCKCGGCKCNIAKELEKKREEEKVHQFLMRLDDAIYGTICSNILSMDPLPNLSRAYAIIIQEERHINIARSKEERGDAVGFVMQVGTEVKAVVVRTKEKGTTCNHYGKTGHDAKDYFQVIGYPDWWEDKPHLTRKSAGCGWGNSYVGRGRG